MAIPFPNLTLAAPSTATAGATSSNPFNVGSGSAGGLPSLAIYALIALAAYYVWKKA